MNNLLSYFLGWFALVFLQIVLVPRLTILGVYPDILMATIIIWGLKRGWKAGLWLGFALGLSIDLLDPQKLGWMTLLFSLSGFMVGVIRDTIYIESMWFQGIMTLFITIGFQLSYRFCTLPGFFTDNFIRMLGISIFIAIYTSIVGIIGQWLANERYRLRNLL
jgi:rod shape-determining protein MreD